MTILDPFQKRPEWANRWEHNPQIRPQVEERIAAAIRGYRRDEISGTEERILRALYIDERTQSRGWNESGIRYNLFYQHHQRNNNLWKYVGRPFWSIEAYRSWFDHCCTIMARRERVRTRHPFRLTNGTIPGGRDNPSALNNDHVVRKEMLIDWLFENPEQGLKSHVEAVLERNFIAVITCDQHRQIGKIKPNRENPWAHYRQTAIRFVPNHAIGEYPAYLQKGYEELAHQGLVVVEEEFKLYEIDTG